MSAPLKAEAGERPLAKVTGFVPPIATPFLDGNLDLDSLKRLLDDLAGSVSGVLVGGSVGEAASLTVDERIRLMNEVASYVDGDLALAVSVADNALENTRRLSEAAGELGADLLMVSCPNYYSNSGPMLTAYFAGVSELATADLCLYDNPLASHTGLTIEDIKALTAAAPRLTHVKVTDTAIDKVEALRSETSLVVLSGDDIVLWHQLTRGAEGAMVALPMIYPQLAAELWRAFSNGDLDGAYAAYRPATNFIHIALGAPDYVAVIKAVLHARGIITSPEVRLPLVAPTARRRDEILASL
jgi:dihydrodipicolinate synthase/N-acetylneuraminate lyase